MKIKEMIPSERPREKMILYGAASLTNAEILALLIKNGTKKENAMQIATRIINSDEKGIYALHNISLEELSKTQGIGTAKATTILVAIELGKRIASSKNIQQGTIREVRDVVDIYMEKLRYEKREHFKMLSLDAKGNIISDDLISLGDLTSSIVSPREVFNIAIKKSASSLIFIHNHPSGDPTPSKEDVKVTKTLIDVAKMLNMSVLDHIVIGDGTFVSMKAKNII